MTFTTTLVSRGPGVAVLLDDQQVATVGEGGKRFPVAATVNGFRWRTTVVRMPSPTPIARSTHGGLPRPSGKRLGRTESTGTRDDPLGPDSHLSRDWEGRLLAAQRGLPRIWPRQPRRSKNP